MKNYIVSAKDLHAFTETVFQKAGLSAEDSRKIADLLIHADLRGVSSHGVIRVKQYVDKIRGGGASLESSYPVIFETGNTAVIDAQGGLGALAGEKAVAIARQKASEHLISIVSVKNSNHFGMAGHWALKLAGDDCIGFACSNDNACMPAPGAKKVFIGNNPFAFAFSAGQEYPEVCVDMATSVAAFGKAMAYSLVGKPIPEGWLLDKDGEPTTDISKFGMLAPMAGHKGFGVAFVIELFATLLSGGVLSPDIHPQADPNVSENASHCFGCINIRAFRDLAGFHADAKQYVDRLHELPMKTGMGTAKYPGEIEYAHKQTAEQLGIVLPQTLVDQLREVAASLGVADDQTAVLTERENV